MGHSWLWVMCAWGQGCMVVHRPRIGSEGRADCMWMGTGLVVHGVRAGCAYGQGWVVGVELVVHGVRDSM